MSPAGPTSGYAVLRGVDRAAFVSALGARLREAGVAVGLTALEDLVRALVLVPPVDRDRLYWTARITLVRRHDELEPFDRVFDSVFADAVLPLTPPARRAAASSPPGADALASLPSGSQDATGGDGLPWVTLPPVVGTGDDDATDQVVPLLRPSELEALSELPFEQLAEHEVEQLGRWLEQRLRTWPTRASRRRRAGHRGRQVSLRPTMARARRTGWEPVELVRVRPVRRPRRVVVLCDVSQSMQAQVSGYVHLMRALTTTVGGEGFAFGTALTRLTPVLRHSSAARAVELATEEVPDRFGGTRIGSSLETLLASHHGEALRGAVVVIASDGWDSEPPERVERAMARLRRRAHRVVWVNPRASAPGFEPLVATLAAALPYCDQMVPADDFGSLAAVFDAICRDLRASSAAAGTVGAATRRHPPARV